MLARHSGDRPPHLWERFPRTLDTLVISAVLTPWAATGSCNPNVLPYCSNASCCQYLVKLRRSYCSSSKSLRHPLRSFRLVPLFSCMYLEQTSYTSTLDVRLISVDTHTDTHMTRPPLTAFVSSNRPSVSSQRASVFDVNSLSVCFRKCCSRQDRPKGCPATDSDNLPFASCT